MAAIKQHLWAEWREQRSNLLGLWAGLLLLILAAQFVGADLYLRDPIAPVLFGALGYLAFTLAVLPRVFGGKSLAGCRGFLARSPSGLDSAFLGKVLFVNLGMAATALVPCGVAAVLIYFRAPVNFRRMFLGHSGFETFAIPLIAVHALPLVLVSWRLQLRWALVGIAMAAVLMFGAVKGTYLGTLDPSKHRFSSEFLLYASLGLILAPWVLAWGSFRRPENEAPQRHLLRSFGLLIVGLSPAWGMGLVSFAKHEFEVRRVVPRSLGFEVHSAFLTPDNRSVFFSGGLRKVDWQGDRSIELYTFSLDMQTLAARNLAEGRVMAETEVGLAYRGTGTFPNASGLVLHRYRPEDPAIQFHIDMETGELVPQEPTVLAWRNATRAAAMGLSTEFAIFHDYVGLGTLARNIIGDVPEWALFDPAGKHTYFEKDLPFTIAPYDFTLRVLPGKWLVSPQCKEGEWTTYDPYTGVLAPETGLQSKTGLFMALPDGRVLAKDNRSLFLYDSVTQTHTHATEEGVMPIAGTPCHYSNSFWQVGPEGDYFVILPIETEPTKRPDGLQARGAYRTYLGRFNPQSNTMHWHDWNAGRRPFGLTRDDQLLYMGRRTIESMDLTTSKTRILYPAPSELN